MLSLQPSVPSSFFPGSENLPKYYITQVSIPFRRPDVGWVSSAAHCRSGRSDPDHDGRWSLSPSCIHLWNVAGKSGTMNSRKKSVLTVVQKKTSPIHVPIRLLTSTAVYHLAVIYKTHVYMCIRLYF